MPLIVFYFSKTKKKTFFWSKSFLPSPLQHFASINKREKERRKLFLCKCLNSPKFLRLSLLALPIWSPSSPSLFADPLPWDMAHLFRDISRETERKPITVNLPHSNYIRRLTKLINGRKHSETPHRERRETKYYVGREQKQFLVDAVQYPGSTTFARRLKKLSSAKE